MRLNDEIYEDIKQAVADMFIDYNIKGVPINSFEVATKIGLTIITYSAMDKLSRSEMLKYSTDGYSVETNNNKWIIYYNDISNDYTRINQTIMHEIGHYILDHTKEGEAEESEAKFFAKYALASPALIHNMRQEKTIENIMCNFDIGFEAASNALNYYKKRLRFGKDHYVTYERQILRQLEINLA
jgi:Zn-dependent peptidase ImmA (M78 family)